jgi:hypothetical protein
MRWTRTGISCTEANKPEENAQPDPEREVPETIIRVNRLTIRYAYTRDLLYDKAQPAVFHYPDKAAALLCGNGL